MFSISALLAFVVPVAWAKREIVETVKVRPDPRSIEGLIAWLETKDPAQNYHPWHNNHCLYARYGHDIYGFAKIGERSFSRTVEFFANYNTDFETWELEYPAPHTFGSALSRARAYQKAHT